MRDYFIRRLLLVIPTMIGVSLCVFILINALPGGPIEQAIGQIRYGGISSIESSAASASQNALDEKYIESLKKYYGFDKPVFKRYFLWLSKILRGNLGISYFYEEPVSQVIFSRLPVSLTFGIFDFILIYLICIPLGILKAVKHKSHFDNLTSSAVFVGYSIPGFALGIILIVLFGGGTFLNIFPMQGLTSNNFNELSTMGKIKDYLSHVILPLISYVITHFAFLTMLMKNSLLEQLKQDYIKTALAKGVSRNIAIFKHALRNALIPIVTSFGGFLGVFFAGSILIETLFGLDGMGRLGFEALLNRDYPVALGLVVIWSFLIIIGNIISDFLYTVVDPRIDYK